MSNNENITLTIDNMDTPTYWLSELDSLGIRAWKLNELNDSYELSNLTDNMKQTLYLEYKCAYILESKKEE